MTTYFYIASQDREGGILCCHLTEDGQLQLLHRVAVDRVAYLCAGEGRIYALLREPFQMQSGVASFRIGENGALVQEGPVQPVHGTISAHILCHRGQLYTANYLSGTTTKMPDRLLAHNGHSVNAERQDCSHPHCITAAPGGGYLCINDLGTDCVYVCDLELREVSRVCVPKGHGPRHLVFSPDGKFAYCANEMGSSVSVFSWTPGKLTLLDTVSAIPEGETGPSSGSAIRLSADGKKLYLSLRGQNCVCRMDVDGAKLVPERWIPTGGESPREIWLEKEYLLCAHENSHDIQVISLKNPNEPKIVSSFPVLRPWCILPVRV